MLNAFMHICAMDENERKSVRYRCEMVLSGDLLRKMNYYFRIGDKIGAIERKYAYMHRFIVYGRFVFTFAIARRKKVAYKCGRQLLVVNYF